MLFFNRKAIGLDIDDRSIEVVELTKLGTRAKVVNFSRQALPRGVVTNGLITNPGQLKHWLNQAFNQAKPNPITAKRIAFSLPETQCYNLVTTIAAAPQEIDEAAIRQLVVKNLPLDLEELLFSYRIIQAGSKETAVFLAAANKAAVNGWRDFFADEQLTVDFIDAEIFAIARDLVYLDPRQPVCLVDIGSVRTNIAILQAAAIYYDNSLAAGGHWFTKSIAQSFNLKLVTAERKKLQLGLNSQIWPVLAKQLKVIASEIKAAVNYYQEHYGGAVKEVVLLGGASRLRGLVDFLQEDLGLPLSLGKTKSLAEKLPLEYYGAIGLAWRALNKKKFKIEPDFLALATDGQVFTPAAVQSPLVNQPIATRATKPVKQVMATKLTAEQPVTVAGDEDLNTGESDAGERRLKNQKKILLAILLLGLLLLPVAFWYRQSARDKQAAVINRYAGGTFSQVQGLVFKLPVSLTDTVLQPGAIKGRIIESTLAAGQPYEQALTNALNEAKQELVKGEVLWPEPLNEIVKQTTLTAPLTVRWLAYSSSAAIKAGLARIDELNQEKIDYAFSSSEVLAVEKTDNANQLILKIKINISSGKQLQASGDENLVKEEVNAGVTDGNLATSSLTEATGSPASTAVPAGKQAIIKNTETGWLNIREGPGAAFGIIKKVNPGEIYEFLAEEGEWIKIKLPDGQAGWAAARYIQLK